MKNLLVSKTGHTLHMHYTFFIIRRNIFIPKIQKSLNSIMVGAWQASDHSQLFKLISLTLTNSKNSLMSSKKFPTVNYEFLELIELCINWLKHDYRATYRCTLVAFSLKWQFVWLRSHHGLKSSSKSFHEGPNLWQLLPNPREEKWWRKVCSGGFNLNLVLVRLLFTTTAAKYNFLSGVGSWRESGLWSAHCKMRYRVGCFARSESSKSIFNGLDLLKVSYKYDTYLTYRILFDISTIDYRVKRLELCTTDPPRVELKAF